jgi:hypothetical protein
VAQDESGAIMQAEISIIRRYLIWLMEWVDLSMIVSPGLFASLSGLIFIMAFEQRL